MTQHFQAFMLVMFLAVAGCSYTQQLLTRQYNWSRATEITVAQGLYALVIFVGTFFIK